MANAVGTGLRLLTRLASSPTLDKYRLRKRTEKAVYEAARIGFRTAGAVNRRFSSKRPKGDPEASPERLAPAGASTDLFDLTPSDDQALLLDTIRDFAASELRPEAAAADAALAVPERLRAQASELGILHLGVPEKLGGVGTDRSATTNVLVAEALAHGDLGLAVACLAPSAVSSALVLWGNAHQQDTYLPAFVGDAAPAAALAVLEPRPLFDPFRLETTARRSGAGYVLNGTKSLVPLAAAAELFVVAAFLEDVGPAFFIVESSSAGLSIEAEPAMGLRAAATGRLILENVLLPPDALLGAGKPAIYAEAIALSRLAWCALAVGTARAVQDYVIPYVNDRVAFGEPISHRQGVAFKIADIAIETEGMRLLTLRAAGLADSGKPFAREVALARRLCADKGMAIGSDGVQLLGGHGFVKEHPVERWYRDLRAVGVMEGALLV